jgi:hypothetical protein
MKLKITKTTNIINNIIYEEYWGVYIDGVLISKFNSYAEAIEHSIQKYGHSAVFPS